MVQEQKFAEGLLTCVAWLGGLSLRKEHHMYTCDRLNIGNFPNIG
jgi:hypothetical protein